MIKTALLLWVGAAWAMQEAGDAQAPVCLDVSAREGWQEIRFETDMRPQIHSITGEWSVDARTYAGVGADGHVGDDAARLAPFYKYKHLPRFTFGALLVRGADPASPVTLAETGQTVWERRMQFRINDSDSTLMDNAGELTVCFNADEDAPRFNDMPARLRAPFEVASCEAAQAELAQLSSDMIRWDQSLERTRLALQRRLTELDAQASTLQTAEETVETPDEAYERAVAVELHNQRVRDYNRDAVAYSAELADFRAGLDLIDARRLQALSCT